MIMKCKIIVKIHMKWKRHYKTYTKNICSIKKRKQYLFLKYNQHCIFKTFNNIKFKIIIKFCDKYAEINSTI